MGNRTWFKIYAKQWLTGSIRDESPIVRSIFIDLLALAGDSDNSDFGLIGIKSGVGLADSQYQKILKVSKSQWSTAKKRLILTERISVNSNNEITIINWQKYQSEYERQKPYRNQKLQPKVTTKSYSGDRDRDRDRDNSVTFSGNGNKQKLSGVQPVVIN